MQKLFVLMISLFIIGSLSSKAHSDIDTATSEALIGPGLNLQPTDLNYILAQAFHPEVYLEPASTPTPEVEKTVSTQEQSPLVCLAGYAFIKNLDSSYTQVMSTAGHGVRCKKPYSGA